MCSLNTLHAGHVGDNTNMGGKDLKIKDKNFPKIGFRKA